MLGINIILLSASKSLSVSFSFPVSLSFSLSLSLFPSLSLSLALCLYDVISIRVNYPAIGLSNNIGYNLIMILGIDSRDRTLLHWAAQHGFIALSSALLSLGIYNIFFTS